MGHQDIPVFEKPLFTVKWSTMVHTNIFKLSVSEFTLSILSDIMAQLKSYAFFCHNNLITHHTCPCILKKS